MLFRKNTQFSRLIKAGGRLKEFNFRKPSPESKIYEVDVSDERGNRFMFTMVQQDEDWIMEGSLMPEWITSVEALLRDAIREEENDFNKIESDMG